MWVAGLAKEDSPTNLAHFQPGLGVWGGEVRGFWWLGSCRQQGAQLTLREAPDPSLTGMAVESERRQAPVWETSSPSHNEEQEGGGEGTEGHTTAHE